ncbi:hypothetical protein [Rothia uropygialis]|uniref:hypothetical protein n=1 Tax=Kocuria sp. 36 TaxID=1415402 RepID=UPI00101D541E|nr:hypothetical protein [Kocuria sp. 36]
MVLGPVHERLGQAGREVGLAPAGESRRLRSAPITRKTLPVDYGTTALAIGVSSGRSSPILVARSEGCLAELARQVTVEQGASVTVAEAGPRCGQLARRRA